ncbi:unnamed protein product [Ceratitis capitata]|uniref:(Mediterranean fruit fly) hypothetical protein n=1 Tax=Ceratitis capitata TaxID=7213 RepID=A0A811U2L2_CERCA|nr:unnamed protein product [Ceratitis capitata]
MFVNKTPYNDHCMPTHFEQPSSECQVGMNHKYDPQPQQQRNDKCKNTHYNRNIDLTLTSTSTQTQTQTLTYIYLHTYKNITACGNAVDCEAPTAPVRVSGADRADCGPTIVCQP